MRKSQQNVKPKRISISPHLDPDKKEKNIHISEEILHSLDNPKKLIKNRPVTNSPFVNKPSKIMISNKTQSNEESNRNLRYENGTKPAIVSIKKTCDIKSNSMNSKEIKNALKVSKNDYCPMSNDLSKSININIGNSNNPSCFSNSFKQAGDKNDKKTIKAEDKKKKFVDIKDKGFYYSEAGKLATGKIKDNQDRCVVYEKIFGLNFNIFGILDGHGDDGGLISEYVLDKILSYFTELPQFTEKHPTPLNESWVYKILSHKNFQVIRSFFPDIDEELKTKDFDSKFSGTTCNLIFQVHSKLICASVGDSSSIFVKFQPNHIIFEYEYINHDHKPVLPAEKKRIERKGGEVRMVKDSRATNRIYLKDMDYPGLAISRTLGDWCAKSVGVTCEPDIIVKDIDHLSQYVVIASDGVWDYTKPEDIIQLMKKYLNDNDPESGSIAIVEKAMDAWKNKNVERDDISAVVIFIGEEIDSKKKIR